MIAVKRLQSLFWLLLVAVGVLGAYLVSLKVATERNALMDVRGQIAAARDDIRYLETEFSARANMRQLERWNAEDFRYSALTADHYLDGERALAHLDGIQPNGPAFVAQPVLVAMVEAEGGVADADQVIAPRPATLQIRSDLGAIGQSGSSEIAMVKTVGVKTAAVKTADVKTNPANAVSATARRAERMASLDARLLDEGTLGDIGRRAAAEIRGGLH